MAITGDRFEMPVDRNSKVETLKAEEIEVAPHDLIGSPDDRVHRVRPSTAKLAYGRFRIIEGWKKPRTRSLSKVIEELLGRRGSFVIKRQQPKQCLVRH